MNAKRVFVKSYGCSTNQADGEALSGCLAAAGFVIAGSEPEADVLVYNCCAVKGPTEDRMFQILKKAPKNKRLVVAGCLPLICYDRLLREVQFDGVVGPGLGRRISTVVESVLQGDRVTALEESMAGKPELALPRLTSNPVISVVPVSYGCLGACSYCCVVFARGHLRSCTPEEITERVNADLDAGAREFWLTSQDVAAYGRDIQTNLADLLKAVCMVPGDFRVRVGMMNPNLVQDMLSELVVAFEDSKVFKFLHLPVQSGNNLVLRSMRRCYTVEEFKEIVSIFRREFPMITLATDVICGFPGEAHEAFDETLSLIDDVKPDVVNVSKFFARPGTHAAGMLGAVEPAELKRRSKELSQLAKRISMEQNQRWLRWTGEIVVDEKGKCEGSWIGRNFAYKPVVVKSPQDLMGKVLCVKVVKAFSSYLSADIQ